MIYECSIFPILCFHFSYQTAEWAIHVVRQALDQLLEAGSGSNHAERGTV